MKFVHALALTLSITLTCSGTHGQNLRQDASRDLVGDAPVVCGNTKCNNRSTCVNDKCVCKLGWTDPPYCRNLDECKELDPPPCKFDGAVCVDEDPHLDGSPGGMYHCACKTKEGWINGPISNDHGPLSCGDLDECSQDPAPCHPNATCTNLKPGFTCTCKDGFEGDGQVSCVPKLPPVDPPKGQQCDKNCLTIPNTFCDETTRKCTCLVGFFSPSGLGGACQGINYCQDNLDNCSPHAQCIPLEGEADAGFFSCECNTGYITAPGFRQGTVCMPHNECSDGTNNCKSNEVCVDLSPPNTFECVLVTASPTPSPTPSPTVAPTPSPTIPLCTGVTCGVQATCNTRTGICECNAGYSGNAKTKCLDNHNVTSNAIFGTGNDNGAFTITRNKGIEVGLRAKLRWNVTTGLPENTFNYDGDHTYSFAAKIYTPSSGILTGIPQPVWNFEWSVNTDFDGTSGLKIKNLTYNLILDFDPAGPFDRTGTSSRIAFDPITPPISPVPDHSIGTSTTLKGQGVETSDLQTYKNLIAANNLIQQSWSYGIQINPTVAGTFTIILTALQGGVPVAETSINVVTTATR
jgi:EGF domain